MKINKLSNEPKDWLKALNIINLFTIVFCVFINKTSKSSKSIISIDTTKLQWELKNI